MNFFWRNRLVDAEQMREMDRKTIEEYKIPGELLMESAGRGVFFYIEQNFPFLEDVVIFCGKGNNGGDGFVVARYLANRQIYVSVYLLGKKQELKGDAQLNCQRFLNYARDMGELIEVENEEELESAWERVSQTNLIIDAIFGTGLNSPVRGLAKRAIEIINEASEEFGVPVISVDIPSGVDASNGQVLGEAVWADATVTFGLAKVGHYTFPGASRVGELELVDICIPFEVMESARTWLVDQELAFSLLRARRPDAHKGEAGHTLIFAGSVGKTGAGAMAGESALRTGAGLVTLAVPSSLNPILEEKLTEVMTEPVPETSEQTFGKVSVERAKKLMEDKEVIAIGPGIGQNKDVDEFFREILLSAKVPVVIDADGLNSLARQMELLEKTQAPLILTPHPGEMSRLTGLSTKEIQSERLKIAREYAQKWGVILVLKGARTVIASPEGEAFLNLSGNPGMASAGMGDVLTGIIAGLVSQGYSPLEASVLGVYIHGKAGDLAYQELGGVGIIAGDLISRIPATRRWLLEQIFALEE